jgi:hypothetical protein
VAGYQQGLERLEELRRRQGGPVRIVGSAAPGSGAGSQPVVGEDGRIEVSSSASRRRVFDDTGQPQESSGRPPPPIHRRSRDVSIARMSHRPRRLGAPIAAAAAVIVLVTGLAIAGAHLRPSHPTAPPTTLKKGHSRTTQTTHPTTTTVPPNFSPSSTSGTDVTYALPFSSYSVTFNATTGACYVQITNSSGSTPYAQVLSQGGTEQIVLSGTSKVTLGAPSDITIQVDRTPVIFPKPLPAPLNITFVGAGQPSTPSTT